MSAITTQTYQAVTTAPSNIAIVKYWGKKGIQEPVNPSISFTLSKALTKTAVSYQLGDLPLNIEFLFEGLAKPDFLPKLQTLSDRLKTFLPILNSGYLKIESSNTFPHSSGIASSASSMASIAKALLAIQKQVDASQLPNDYHQMLSEMARLGSGSACRSTMPGWVLWGETSAQPDASNKYGLSINHQVHDSFNDLQDTILVIRKGSKAVSSSLGHALMAQHPYQQGRIEQANKNTIALLKAMKEGDFATFSRICEEEALSLHGLMMSSSPGYNLMAPESLRAIKRIVKFREHQHVPVTYTLDAGPNIHLIYPQSQSKVMQPFIEEHLKPLCDNQEVIYDEISID